MKKRMKIKKRMKKLKKKIKMKKINKMKKEVSRQAIILKKKRINK